MAGVVEARELACWPTKGSDNGEVIDRAASNCEEVLARVGDRATDLSTSLRSDGKASQCVAQFGGRVDHGAVNQDLGRRYAWSVKGGPEGFDHTGGRQLDLGTVVGRHTNGSSAVAEPYLDVIAEISEWRANNTGTGSCRSFVDERSAQVSEAQAIVDSGLVHVTTKRIVFKGGIRTIDWTWCKLGLLDMSGDSLIVLGVSNRQETNVIRYASHYNILIDAALQGAYASDQGLSPDDAIEAFGLLAQDIHDELFALYAQLFELGVTDP